MTDRVVFFLHLPKAAGSTLNRVIAQQYPPAAIYKTAGKPPAVNAQELAANLRTPGGIRLVAGHFGFGLHGAVPGEFTYITMLRDPVERLLSHFHFARRLQTHPLHAEITSGRLTLPDVARRLANLQTRYLADEAVRGTAESAGAETLASAQENLRRHFSVVGLAERFNESLILLQRRLGWKVRAVANSNVTRGRPARAAHGEEDLAAVRAANLLDIELYAAARARFAEEVDDAGLGFRIAVNWLGARQRVLRYRSDLLRRDPA
jgi:Galactose-3-O-sulfotransferase